MPVVRVHLDQRSYSILIGTALITRLNTLLKPLDLGPDAFVITNTTIKRHYAGLLQKALCASGRSVQFSCVPDSERSKSIKTAALVLERLARWGSGRKPFIIALGGGVIGDLAGFVAAVYKRGIPYVQIPTTLLAQVDSAIGGKTGLDLPAGKNLVGAFYQPRLVISDITLLKTLPRRQIRAAMAEIIKYALIRDTQFFAYLQSNLERIKQGGSAQLFHVVKRCSSIKAQVVSADERETRGVRTILNFGHTIGHAIEAAAGYRRYNHGEAVALGMLTAARISRAMGLLKGTECEAITALIARAGLPVRVKRLTRESIIKAHYTDKKFIARRNRFVLLERIGKAKVVSDVPLEVIKEAVADMIK